MYRLIALIIILSACMPLPQVPATLPPTAPPLPTDTPPQYLNDNPDMTLGDCGEVVYDAGWGDDYIDQCTPDGYTLYEDSSLPISAYHTGAAYSIRPRGASGAIGYTLPGMRLDEGCYLVKVAGFAHMWGSIGDYWLQAEWHTPDMQITRRIGRHSLMANGDYLAVFVLDAPARNDYIIDVFLWLQFASATDDSFLTMEAITVEEVDRGYCGRG